MIDTADVDPVMIERAVLGFLLTLIRVAGFVSSFPAFSGRRVPRTVKMGFVLSLTAIWATKPDTVIETLVLPGGAADWALLLLLVVREALFGIGLGFAFGFLIIPARIAGTYIGQEMGLSLASVADPSSGTPSGVVSQILEWLTILLLFVLDVHHVLLHALNLSFQSIAVGERVLVYPAMELFMQMDMADRWSLLIAAPIGICLFLTLVVMGLLVRAVPHMNIFSMGVALRAGMGMLALLIFLPALLRTIVQLLSQSPVILRTLG